MNEFTKKILSVLARGLCNQMGCEDCRDLFNCEACPCDWTSENERPSVVEKLMNLISDNGFVINISEEELVNILKSE